MQPHGTWDAALLSMSGAVGDPGVMWLHWRRPLHGPTRVQVGANPSSASSANVSREASVLLSKYASAAAHAVAATRQHADRAHPQEG